MGFNLNGIGSLISKLPGGKEAVGVINAVGNPIVQVVSIPVNIATSMATGMAKLQQSLMQSATNAAQGLSSFVSSPLFTYAVIGGLGIAGVYVIQNGGNPPLPPQMARILGK